MPTYEYNCPECGNDFERFESITAKPNKACPKCNKKKAIRRISGGGGFIFKGSGFYLTDYKKHPGGTDKTDAKPAEKKSTEAAPAAAGGCSTGCACHPAPAATPAKTASKKSA